METIITRIVEIEKQCTAEVEQAERESKERVEAHRQALEERKKKEFAAIEAANKESLARALEEAGAEAARESEAVRRDHERLEQDAGLKEEVRGKILSMLLSE